MGKNIQLMMQLFVYYDDTLSYNGKYYEECRNLGDVINEYVGDEQGKTY